MKITPDLLYFLCKLQKILLSRSHVNIIDIIATYIGSNPVEVKKGLYLLQKLKVIQNLKISRNAFSFELIKKEPLSANMLVEEYGYYLIAPDLEQEIIKMKDEKIKSIMEEKKNLEKKIRELERDIECLKKYGKTRQQLIEDALINHGD